MNVQSIEKQHKMQPESIQKSMKNRCDYHRKVAKIAPGVGLGAPRLPQGDCFARQCTNLAVEVAPPDDFFVILVALGRRRAPFGLKVGARASPIPCKIMTKIHGEIYAEKVLKKGCQNHGKWI